MECNTKPKKPLKHKQGSTKIDPSFKSKRYRDKLRTEVKSLESLIPIDRPTLHRKLDSQTVYRLVIAFLRVKNYFEFVHPEHTSLAAQTGPDENTKSTDRTAASECGAIESKLLKEINLNELMEGFIMMLSVDGTIMYVSENVLHFNGFNQVDLIHRCIYGVIHPNDQYEVRNTLEENGLHSFNHQMRLNNTRRKSDLGQHREERSTVSFFCRMKCFVGNTAGYMKLHFSGKVRTLPCVPRSSKTSDRIAVLFCQPFIYNGNDVTNDSKDNTFWSKHDLDLTFKETEKKITEILGYDESELKDMSMYQLVHVEDLHTLVMAHKAITEVSDVQSFFMRLKHKDGTWTWLHSKGKVISKNSKKFSVVFTHCPIRDDNSAFLQQEMLLRRKHSLSDLLHQFSFGKITSDHVTNIHMPEREIATSRSAILDCYPSYKPIQRHQEHYTRTTPVHHPLDSYENPNPNDEVSLILNPMTFVPSPCPSTWHSTLDRHSPVVPSSHVAHKLCLKEKQLQFAQLKRSQRSFPKEETFVPCFSLQGQWDPKHVYLNSAPQHSSNTMGQRRTAETNNDLYKQSLYLYNAGPTSQQKVQIPNQQEEQSDGVHYCVNYHPTQFFNYPPSPPPSPMRCAANTVTAYSSHFGMGQHTNVGFDPGSLAYEPAPSSHPRHFCVGNSCTTTDTDGDLSNSHMSKRSRTDAIQYINPHHSFTNIKFSMTLNAQRPPTNSNDFMADLHPSSALGYPNNHLTFCPSPIISKQEHDIACQANHVKYESEGIQSCYNKTDHVPLNPSSDCVHYDVEASIHMKIVEAEGRSSQKYPEVEIPAFDSFMDYLTDEKIY